MSNIDENELHMDEQVAAPAPYNDHSDSELSDLDETFDEYNAMVDTTQAEAIPLDEDTIATLGKYKKKGNRAASEEEPPKPQKRRRRDRARDDDEQMGEAPVPEIELTEAEKKRRDMDKLMDDAIKTKKKAKRRKTDVDLEKMDDEAVDNLRMKMIEAANADTEAIEAGNPATSKLSMVDEVRDTLGRQNLLNIAVDCGILRGIRRWLEPLPNKTLPAYNVQKLMFEILAKLKPDIVHLRESGIGRIVMFYTKDSRPQRLIKREAEKLVRDWSRPILGRSDDYRSRAIPIADGRSSAPSSQRRKSVDDTKHSALAAPVKDTGRARVMMPQSHSYEVAPVSRLNNVVGPIRPITARGDEFIRKMKAKKAARR
ncbi:hypothetical protein FPQ18DRAFT_323325 [Pyronema domesticum]|uniref:Similar to Transcription factor IWS1 acc. no. Q6CGB2 n=1 Tax=Pyronema omphalodes (strain CBS 100304) TaxID=1076935 RepID=U4KTW9_PYROM|nr:hypothetical protein FPQ18DRAFT_323325 [Pyronema domesticum]CCX04252.1 Similar to Transcription factor IWS1; acc. no. Q6CGB2 [Pyronema omphalodes CBS 100304]